MGPRLIVKISRLSSMMIKVEKYVSMGRERRYLVP